MPTWTVPVGAVTATQVTGLQPGSGYTLRIRAVDAAGNLSPYSTSVTATTAVAPATVAAVAAVPVPSVSGGGTLNATATPGTVTATASVPAPAAGAVRTASTAATSVQVTGLLQSSPYTARVRAVDADGNRSAWSAPVAFSTVQGALSPATVAAVTTIPAPSVGGVPPTVTAGLPRPVVVGGSIGLDVTVMPPGGATVTGYSWTILAGAGSLTNSTTATPTYVPPGSGSGTATVRVTVFTSNGGSATADCTVSFHTTIVAAENALTGTPRATWDLTSPNLGGIDTLQGFCDGFSVDKTGVASFKIAQSDGAGWSAEIYRLGYYANNGARSYGTLTPSAPQLAASQAQPAPTDVDPDTTLPSTDCSAWATTLTWTPPAWAPSGMYVLRLSRTGGGASHVLFVLRDDAREADLMLMPSDSTWQAYNAFGGMGSSMYAGNSLYFGTLVNQYASDTAHYVSYNRPIVNRGAADAGRSYGAVEWSTFFTGEYPMLRFAERNGIDVKYYGCIDAAGDPTGTHLTGGSGRGGVGAAMMVGHNEYWSSGMRSGWEAAKNAGVNLFVCSSNEVFWRTAGSNPDADGRPRVIECQKSTINGRGSSRPEWTGTWRDPDGAGKGGGLPENTLTGSIYMVNGPDLRSMVVPFAGGYSQQPLWRHTTVAALTTGQTWTSPGQVLGFEWDAYGAEGTTTTGANFAAPAHPRARYCSDVSYNIGLEWVLADAGDVYTTGTVTHRLSVHPGGAGGITFATGSINWALGCDAANLYQTGQDNTTVVIQQATINMLVDMGAPPASLMAGLTEPTPVDWYTDSTPGTVTATTTIPTPTVVAGSTLAPGTVTASTTIPAPTVQTAGNATVNASTVTAAASVPGPAVQTGATVTAGTVTAVSTVPVPLVGTHVTVTLTTVAGVAAIASPAVTVQAHTTVMPTAVMAVAGVPVPAIRTGQQVIPGRFRAGSMRADLHAGTSR